MTSEFQKLFGPASPLADRRKAQAMNGRADMKYFVAESLRKAGELEEAVSQDSDPNWNDSRLEAARN